MAIPTYKPTPDEKREFMAAALICAREMGLTMPTEMDVHSETLLALYRKWGGDGQLQFIKTDPNRLDMAEAVALFRDFLRAREGEFSQKAVTPRGIDINYLGVEIQVPLGVTGKLSFRAGGTIPEDADAEEKKDYYGQLFQTAWKGYMALNEYPEAFRMPVKHRAYEPKAGDTADTFEFTSVISVNTGGKRDYKVKGGQFLIHGVRVFPEVLMRAGIDPATIDGEKFVYGTALYEKKANGDPYKVLQLTLKQQEGI